MSSTTSKPMISVENLGKSYLVGHVSADRERYTALRDVIGRHARNLVRNARDMAFGRQIIHGDEVEEFWALQDVSFDVHAGEVLGIVGRNGAGKSTLLKVLSRITEPTLGRIVLRGKVASLLEVGTGFHPELTGRENIFLNGAILSMTRVEIKKKFDEIVSFAEIERFLDTPVKRYSSGMYVRLAFAVAAHLDPEILIIDEVLAVGDSHFQKKCLGKMHDVASNQGRTVLFVSHNMAAVKSLCTRAICLEKGTLVANDIPDIVIHEYLHADAEDFFDGHIPDERPRQFETGELRFTQVSLLSRSGNPTMTLETGSEHEFVVRFTVKQEIDDAFLELGITDRDGNQLTQSRWPLHARSGLRLSPGDYEVRVKSSLNLFPGSYAVLLAAHRTDGTTIEWVERALDLEVVNASTESPHHHPWAVRGFLRPDDHWSEPRLVSRDSVQQQS
jgi:lipopolysaccharide transport system ATP-binding protein